MQRRKKRRKTSARKLRDRGLRGLATLDISLSEEDSSDRRPQCGTIGQPLVLSAAARLEERRAGRKQQRASRKEFFLQPPEAPDDGQGA